jgi:apolipoprotein D and lipocalin family protein
MKYLWILSRTPRMDEQRYRSIVGRLKDRGFEIAKLRRTPQGNRED